MASVIGIAKIGNNLMGISIYLKKLKQGAAFPPRPKERGFHAVI